MSSLQLVRLQLPPQGMKVQVSGQFRWEKRPVLLVMVQKPTRLLKLQPRLPRSLATAPNLTSPSLRRPPATQTARASLVDSQRTLDQPKRNNSGWPDKTVLHTDL